MIFERGSIFGHLAHLKKDFLGNEGNIKPSRPGYILNSDECVVAVFKPPAISAR